MTPEEEKKNKRVGMIISLGIHSLVILIFALLMAYRPPNPPLPEYGIELNFGTDDAGTGEVQPETPVVQSENLEEASPEAETSQEQEETLPEETPEEITEETVDQQEVFEDTESTDVVKEEEKTVKEPVEEKVEDPVPVEDPKEEEPKKEVEDKGVEGKEGETTDEQAVNQGDKTDETGDQGNEQGKVDERALYGKPGGGGGSSLEMAGWMWDFKPNPKDTSDESGRIVFEIRIDDQGEIISIRTLERTVSPSVEQIYRAEVEKLTFSKTDNLPPAPQSVGRITFLIKSN